MAYSSSSMSVQPNQQGGPAPAAIELDRLRHDILELAEIGKIEGKPGVHRLGFSDADMESRRWLMAKIEAAGGTARMDEAGNVIGRWFDSDEACVMTGSHIDSVPSGGIFDGTLGVLTGLECARVLQTLPEPPKRPFEVVAFADEEGRFGGMFGVQALTGTTTLEWIHQAHDVGKVYLADAMAAQGFNPDEALNATRKAGSVHAFCELHIEQGPVLEQKGLQIGVVEGISGVFKWMVRLVGKANHAGTAPMDMRSDAFMGLADFAHEIPRIIAEEGTDKSRLTVGKVELKPGNPHTVPGEAEFSIVGRDIDLDVMKAIGLACRKALSAIARRHNLHFDFEELSWLDPAPCHPDIIALFKSHAERMGLSHQVMPSGAGHDTQFMAEFTRAGMIFVPSVGGISHAPDEWTHWRDIEQGASLLYETLKSLLYNEAK